MGYFVLLHIDEKPVLQDVINNLIEKNITFTISSNPHQLVTKAEGWYADEQKAGPSGQGPSQPKIEVPQQPQQQQPQPAPQQQQRPVLVRFVDKQQPSSSADPTPLLRRGRPPLKRKMESPGIGEPSSYQAPNQSLNAADLLGDDAAEVTPSSFVQLPPLAGGARVVRLVRSDLFPPVPAKNAPLKTQQLQEDGGIIRIMEVTAAVDMAARSDSELAILMMKEGYIPSESHCTKCGYLMEHRTPMEWKCMRIGCRGSTTSVVKNTWFGHIGISLKKILKVIILWGKHRTTDEIRRLLEIELKHIWLIENRIRETCLRIVESYEPLGGPGVEVQLGIQLVGARRVGGKVNRQILGGVEPHTGRCFFHLVTVKKPLYTGLAHWVRPGSVINGKYYDGLPSFREATDGNLWKMWKARPHVVELFNRLKSTNIGEMIGETFPGYLAELMIRFNEDENTLRKFFYWLRLDMQPGPDGLMRNTETPSPTGDKPISEEERPLTAEIVKEEVDT